ncbi:MAG: MlaD family protein [Desulfocapsaceae bacterium]|nr:MlaD family protein [Desulfocapsaceae bacterium]
MNSHGSHFIIGLFVLAGIIGTFVFGLWLADSGRDTPTTPYIIHFEESVAGLRVGSRVSYRGIPIGFVGSIRIKPDDPEHVSVLVNIEEQYRLRQGDVASLKLEGITGTSYINIEGAGQDTPFIDSSEDEVAVIPSQKSELELVVQGFPDLLNQASVVLNRIGELLNKENRLQIEAILTNLNTLTESLASQDENITNMFVTVNNAGEKIISLSEALEDVVGEVGIIMARVDELIEGVDTVVTEDGQQLISEWQKTAISLRKVAGSLNLLLDDNEESLEHFSREGLKEFTLFMQEARILVAGLTRVVESLESSGARFLLDQHVPEINPEE